MSDFFSQWNDGGEVYMVDTRGDKVHEPGKIKLVFHVFQFY